MRSLVGGGDPYAEIRTQVAEIIRGRIIVGHRLWEDLSVRTLKTAWCLMRHSPSIFSNWVWCTLPLVRSKVFFCIRLNAYLRNALETRDVALYLPLRKRLGTERHMIIDLPRLVQEFMHRLIAVENQDAVRFTLIEGIYVPE